MLESEKFAIAAHLHVTLRRANGRVTDVEWMVKSADYAREIIRVARAETHPDLLRLADKLEAAFQPPVPEFLNTQSGLPSGFANTGSEPELARKRYVGSLR